MSIRNVREMVNGEGIAPRGLGKLVVIQKPQLGAGNFDCLAKACAEYCDHFAYLWREYCLPLSVASGREN